MLKVSIVMLAVMLAFAGVYSLLNIFATELVSSSAFEAVSGKALDGIQDGSFLAAYLWANRYVGVFALCTTIAGFFILLEEIIADTQYRSGRALHVERQAHQPYRRFTNARLAV